jgi:hypothetical protein
MAQGDTKHPIFPNVTNQPLLSSSLPSPPLNNSQPTHKNVPPLATKASAANLSTLSLLSLPLPDSSIRPKVRIAPIGAERENKMSVLRIWRFSGLGEERSERVREIAAGSLWMSKARKIVKDRKDLVCEVEEGEEVGREREVEVAAPKEMPSVREWRRSPIVVVVEWLWCWMWEGRDGEIGGSCWVDVGV